MAGRKGGSKTSSGRGNRTRNESRPTPARKGRASQPTRKPEASGRRSSVPESRPPRAPARKKAAPEGPHRAGFALLLGRPNVGKSTLLNRLVGEHLAIVSPRPQTTRNRILGIVSEPGTQLCLIDAPGVHKAKGLLNRSMVQAAMTAIQEVDVVLYLAEAGWPAGSEPGDPNVDIIGLFHRELLADVAKTGKPTVLVLTKIDIVPKHALLPVMEAWAKAFPFKEIYPLSGLTGENTHRFVDVLRKYLPEGPPLFPSETVTDQPERALAAEFIREQVFLQTHEEVPYGVAITIDEFDESERPLPEEASPAFVGAEPEAINAAISEQEWAGEEQVEEEEAEEEEPEAERSEQRYGETLEQAPTLGSGLVRIQASIVVERDSHKGIIIGHRGERLKKIGTAARHHIERLLGTRVWLGLHVRVIPGWTEKKSFLSELGYLNR